MRRRSQAFHDRFGFKIHSFYGASETGGIAYDASDALMPDGHVGTADAGRDHSSCGRMTRRQQGAAASSSAAILSRPDISPEDERRKLVHRRRVSDRRLRFRRQLAAISR